MAHGLFHSTNVVGNESVLLLLSLFFGNRTHRTAGRSPLSALRASLSAPRSPHFGLGDRPGYHVSDRADQWRHRRGTRRAQPSLRRRVGGLRGEEPSFQASEGLGGPARVFGTVGGSVSERLCAAEVVLHEGGRGGSDVERTTWAGRASAASRRHVKGGGVVTCSTTRSTPTVATPSPPRTPRGHPVLIRKRASFGFIPTGCRIPDSVYTYIVAPRDDQPICLVDHLQTRS